MTTSYFKVQAGIQTGDVVIDAASGNFTGVGNITIVSTASANLGNAAIANYFVGNGIFLSNTAGANVSGQVGNALLAGTVYTNAQPNITSVGTLASLTVTGNISGGNLVTSNTVFAPEIVQNASTYDTRVSLSSVTGLINITSGGNSTKFAPSGVIELGGASQITGGTFGGSGVTLGTSQTDVFQNRGGNVTVQVGTGGSIAKTWTFENGGNLSAPGKITSAGLVSNSTVDFTTASNVSLGAIGNLHITGGAAGYVLQTDGSGTLTFASAGSTGIAGIDKQVQFNDGGSFGASANFTFDKSTKVLTVDNITANGAGITYLTGANVNGNVSNAVQSHYANIANSVAGANVSGQVGNALVAGTVYTNAQPNITSVGTLASVDVTGNANVGNFVATGTGSFGANVNMQSKWVNNVGYPSLSTDAATKSYVDTMITSGITYHQPVYVATTSTLAVATGGTTAYNSPNGAANGIGAYISTTGTYLNIDGANVQTVGTRILVKDEANSAWNGVYTYANTTAIVRSTDTDEYGSDSTEQISINDYFFTTGGTANKGIAWVVSAPSGTITFGTSNITFSEFSTSQVYTAGTGLTLTNTTFSVNASQTQITSVGTLASLSVTGNITAGNVDGGNLVTANYFSGNGIYISNIAGANVSGTVANATYATSAGSSGSATSATTAGTVTTNAQPNITSVGTLSSVTVTGNITSGNADLGNLVTANYFTGNGIYISNIAGANVSGTVANATYATSAGTAGSATTAGTVTTNAQPNITSVGTLAGLTGTGVIDFTTTSNVALGAVGNVHITGGSSGQVLRTDGAGILSWVSISSSSISNGTSNVSIPATDGNVVIGVSGNAAILTVTGTGANVSGYLNVGSGNITAGNIAGGNLVSANYFSGNGSYLSDIAGGNVVGNVSSAVQSHYANIANSVAGANVSGQVGNALVAGTVYTNAQPNITSVGTLTSVTVTGNTISGNVSLNGGLTSNRSNIAVTTNTVIDEFATGTYRTAKYIISASGDDGYQSVESILVHDGTNSYISIYGSVCSNVSADLIELSSNIASGNVKIYATSASLNANVNLLVTYLKT